jgi:Tol biopolymer transport system component
MLLAAGTHIGPYEVAELLGVGGMGEVYRARDPRLGRDVAVKVLREGIADRRRFLVEAQAASRLNHPNIVSIYDIGEEDDCPYIIFELLDGDSLRTLLTAGPLPLRRLLDITVQVAHGLSAAHAANITHRDLKPENIMILRDGQVKILDFGLAKSTGTAEGDSETRTAQGVLLGTIAYMSPEQAQGGATNFRSDQFSFGAIVYEMATGTPAFRRADRVSTMAAVVREEAPSLASVSPAVPAPVRWMVERCLAKDPAQRYASTADLYHQLRDIRDHLSEVFSSDASLGALAVAQPRYRRWARRTGAAIAVLIAGFGIGAFVTGERSEMHGYRFTPFAAEAADETEPAWSSDGKALTYTAAVNGVPQVFARRLDSLMPAAVTSARSACRYPFWSVDGSRIYYWSASSLWSVAAVGGSAQEVLPDVTLGYPPASLSPDGRTMAFFRPEGPRQRLWLTAVAGGTPRPYDRAPFPGAFRLCGGVRFSPDGRKLLVWMTRNLESGSELWVVPYPSGQPHLVESPLLAGFQNVTASWAADSRHVAISSLLRIHSGHVYLLDSETGTDQQVTMGTGEERDPVVSPDGNRMAFTSGGAAANLMEASVDGASLTPLLATPRHQYSADWAPSGWQFAYVSDASGIPEVWVRSTSEGWAMPVVRDAPEGQLAYATPRFSPDGQRLAYVRVGAKHLIWITNLSGGVAAPLEQESRDQHAPAWSPDGRWIAYVRYIDSKWQIAKVAPGGGAAAIPIADGANAASRLEWSPAGDHICFSEGEEVRAVPAAGGSPKSIAKGVAAFTFARDGGWIYAVRRAANRHWELALVSVPGGIEGRIVPLQLPLEASVTDARMHPDGKRLVLSVSTLNRDIWILDGLQARGWRSWFANLLGARRSTLPQP